MKRSFTYSHWVNSNSNPKRENICELKRPLHSFGQRVPKCTPILGLLKKTFWENLSLHLFPLGSTKLSGVSEKFLSGKKPSHLFGIAKPNDTLFHRKIRKYFFGCRCFILLPSKSLFTYSHWEQPNAHPESQKIFTHSLIWNWEVKTQPVFQKNGKKNLPAYIGGHTFNTKNIIGLLKYSERIHIGWIIRQKVL